MKGRHRSANAACAPATSDSLERSPTSAMGGMMLIRHKLRVTDILELRLKKSRQEHVHFQQALTIEPYHVAGNRGNSLLHQRVKTFAEHIENFLAEFPAEIGRVQLAGLQLQNHFANEQLMRRERQGAVDRQLAGLDRGEVVLP